MKKLAIIICLLLASHFLPAQPLKLPPSEMQMMLFITESWGSSSTIFNPAGLARKRHDDGLFANYNSSAGQSSEEYNYAFSMGNLGFSYQDLRLDPESWNAQLNYYRLGMAIGGKIFALGTSSKIIDLEFAGSKERVFSLDAGFIFQPVNWITLAGFGRDLDEPTIGGFTFKREYTAGLTFNLPENYVRILIEGTWDDSIQSVEDSDFKLGLAFSPSQNFDIIIGGIRNLISDEQYFAYFRIPIWNGVQASGSVRINQNWTLQRYFASLYFPLQTVTF